MIEYDILTVYFNMHIYTEVIHQFLKRIIIFLGIWRQVIWKHWGGKHNSAFNCSYCLLSRRKLWYSFTYITQRRIIRMVKFMFRNIKLAVKLNAFFIQLCTWCSNLYCNRQIRFSKVWLPCPVQNFNTAVTRIRD